VFGTVSPLDPEFFLGVDEFAAELLGGERSGKYSPVWVATQLEQNAENASAELQKAKSKVGDANNPEFRRLAVDVTIQAGLGKFFAAKFRAGLLFAIYKHTDYLVALEEAMVETSAAGVAWTEMADAAKGIYRDDVTFGPDYYQRGHWQDRFAAVHADLVDMEKVLASIPSAKEAPPAADAKRAENAIRAVLERQKSAEPPPRAEYHTPPSSFRRGQALPIAVHALNAAGVRLRYRHVNQAEPWQMVEMQQTGKDFRAKIPAAYTDSPFPLQYHFQIRDGTGKVGLSPGLKPGWQGQPYFVVRQA
jgi:hypothetical protein